MKQFILLILLLTILLPVHVYSEAIMPPEVPSDAMDWMPDNTSDFGTGIVNMLQKLFPAIRTELYSAIQTGLAVYACVLLISVFRSLDEKHSPAELAGVICITISLLQNSHTMILLALKTILEISEYSKLFLPAITSMLTAQGAITSSAALYVATSVFTTLLSNVLCQIMIPCVYLFLVASIAYCALDETMIKGIKDQIKIISIWFLKVFLTVFLSYISITGVLTGTSDKAALKATKAAISTAVPVIGSSLADASEAFLLSINLAKNALGIYGIFAFLAIFLFPFVKIGTHYLILKAIAAICSIPGSKRLSNLVNDFCSALGLLLGMTGSICVLSVIGAVCFLKGFE